LAIHQYLAGHNHGLRSLATWRNTPFYKQPIKSLFYF
jgi:hypothetical protein